MHGFRFFKQPPEIPAPVRPRQPWKRLGPLEVTLRAIHGQLGVTPQSIHGQILPRMAEAGPGPQRSGPARNGAASFAAAG